MSMAEAQAARPPHLPVLYQPVIDALRPASPGKYVDATVGAGGHAAGILQASAPDGLLLGLDRDPNALALAAERLAGYASRLNLRRASFTTLTEQLAGLGWKSVAGILIDLGVSSMQLDTPGRGFSFLQDGPLDMRLDPDADLAAADLVNQSSEAELADIFWKYGEEPLSRKFARFICQNRPLHSTGELAALLEKAAGGRRQRIHPATRAFQALRIAVNDELQAIEMVLPQAIAALAPGARLAIIAFHSLEDRLVKQYFRRESRDCICPPGQPYCTCGHKASLLEINRHPIVAAEDECQYNPRARSARLRVVEKILLA